MRNFVPQIRYSRTNIGGSFPGPLPPPPPQLLLALQPISITLPYSTMTSISMGFHIQQPSETHHRRTTSDSEQVFTRLILNCHPMTLTRSSRRRRRLPQYRPFSSSVAPSTAQIWVHIQIDKQKLMHHPPTVRHPPRKPCQRFAHYSLLEAYADGVQQRIQPMPSA